MLPTKAFVHAALVRNITVSILPLYTQPEPNETTAEPSP